MPFNGQSYLKQKRPGTSDQLLFRLPNKFRDIPLLVIYYLNKFDDVVFELFQKLHLQIYANYSSSICTFESGKCGKEGEKYKNVNILRLKELFR